MHAFLTRRRQFLSAGGSLAASAFVAPAWPQAPDGWAALQAKARGQQVFFNAWGGSERTNAYLQWAAEELMQRHGVRMTHVKITDTAAAVKRVRSEKAAGRLRGGSVDMVWINGENFLTLKREHLLLGPFTQRLPNLQWVDLDGKPTTRVDFSEPVDGMEAPWGMAQFTFFADRRRVPEPPASMAALLDWARRHPGRLAYPRPPDFHGTTFLKQALLEAHAERSALYRPHAPAAFEAVTRPLWQYLDALHPLLWKALDGRNECASCDACFFGTLCSVAMREVAHDCFLEPGETFLRFLVEPIRFYLRPLLRIERRFGGAGELADLMVQHGDHVRRPAPTARSTRSLPGLTPP